MRILLIAFLLGVSALFILPSISDAAGLVPDACTDGQACQTCDLVALINNIVTWLVKIMATLCALVVAFAGLKMVTAGGDPGAISAAREMITNVVVGFIILLSAWLVVDTVMKMFVDETKMFGPWNVIKCEAPPAPPVVQEPTPGIIVDPNDPTLAKIKTAAEQMRGFDTSSGPDNGNKACAWAVNKVLQSAGVPTIDGDSVASMESSLQGGRGTQVPAQQALPGDVVIEAGKGHVGICMNVGCTNVLSNSSSKSSFSWVSNTSFAPSYINGPGRIYRVN